MAACYMGLQREPSSGLTAAIADKAHSLQPQISLVMLTSLSYMVKETEHYVKASKAFEIRLCGFQTVLHGPWEFHGAFLEDM